MLASVSTPQLPDPGDTGVTKEKQEQIGRQATAEVYRRMPVLPDSSTETQYVRQLGRKLMANIPPEYNWPYEFHVIPQKEINAFALPGGPVFVNLGSILAADNEAELAGVMAHEMSHVYMQHSIKQMKKTQMTRGITGVLGAVLGSMGGAAGALGQMGAGVAGGVLTMKYSRADEAQADAVGAIIMYKAGYDPRYLARLLPEAGQHEQQPPAVSERPSQSRQPHPGDRRRGPQLAAQGLRERQRSLRPGKGSGPAASAPTARRRSRKARAAARGDSRTATTAPCPAAAHAAAMAANNGNISSVSYREIQPSDNFRLSPTTCLRFPIPTTGGSSATRTAMALPSSLRRQDARHRRLWRDDQCRRHQSFFARSGDRKPSSARWNNRIPRLRARGRPQPVRVNGVEGRSVDLAGDSPIEQDGRRQPEHDWLVALPRSDGTVLYAVFIAPERDFSELRPTFESMLRSLHLR